jgi:competence protein ComEC
MLGKTFQKQSNSYNTLVLSAFILLLFNPFLIIDVGFLLSYFAVFGILYLYPILDSMYYIEHKVLKWFWSSCLISIAATIFTLPITLYFFHQFPIWFVLSNLIIIPISLLVMFLALCVVLFHPSIQIQNILSKATNVTVDFMIQASNLSNSKYYGYIDNISFDLIDALFLSVSIALLLVIFKTKSYKRVVLTFIICIAWVITSIVKQCNQMKEQEIVVFHIKKKSFFVTRIGQDLYYDLNRITEFEFEKHIKPYTIHYPNLKIHHTSCNMMQLNKQRFLNLQKPHEKVTVDSLNYILVSHNSFVNLNNLKMSKPLIIGDCSNTNKTLQRLKKECAKYHLPFYNIKEQGALILSVKNEAL